MHVPGSKTHSASVGNHDSSCKFTAEKAWMVNAPGHMEVFAKLAVPIEPLAKSLGGIWQYVVKPGCFPLVFLTTGESTKPSSSFAVLTVVVLADGYCFEV